jgi:hypothetical protein
MASGVVFPPAELPKTFSNCATSGIEASRAVVESSVNFLADAFDLRWQVEIADFVDHDVEMRNHLQLPMAAFSGGMLCGRYVQDSSQKVVL